MIRIIIITALLNIIVNNIFGQNLKPCGNDIVHKELWAKHPELKDKHENTLKELFKNSIVKNKSNTYIIPIVFHIVHEYGAENISDAQIYDQVDILNRDYRKLNADTSVVYNTFKNIVADCHIEFRLPSVDMFGNCTNGIEHIYSHETNNGDDFSKLNSWVASKYLNVWVVNKMRDGVAGYAYYPTDITSSLAPFDGVIILNEYIGSIGTSSVGTSRALTHEIGHYLGLSHTWGSTNEPGVMCGDDDIPDTPKTKGFTVCPSPNQAQICTAGVVENYQNYMDYSYCSVMFTEGQSTAMTNTLNLENTIRNFMVSPDNLEFTGALVNPKPICKPVADFTSNQKIICFGDAVDFKDVSWNAVVDNRTWYFEGGNPSSATSANVTVNYETAGWKRVKLVVSNSAGSDSLVLDNYIYVTFEFPDYIGTHSEDFNSSNGNFFVINPENNLAKWERISQNGVDNSPAFLLKNYYVLPSGPVSNDEYYYNNRLGGNKDALVSTLFDFNNTTHVNLSFDYAYATRANSPEEITEKLLVYVSKNCGKTWILKKALVASELLTAGNYSTNFLPTNANQWKHCSIDFDNYFNSNDRRVRFKFEFLSSDFSNNVLIDNVNISGILNVSDLPINEREIVVYPNPLNENSKLNVSFLANDKDIIFELRNLNGQIVLNKTCDIKNQFVNFELLKNENITNGCYFLSIIQGDSKRIEKVIIE